MRITTAPCFPGASHLLSELAASDARHLDLRSEERTFRLDLPRCRAKAGFTTHIDIEEPIHASFEVPAEVARIDLAEVADARTGSDALLNIGFDLENTPVKHLYFDDIEITLPDFLVVEHPSLVAGTNTLRIDRAEYRGGYVHVTDVTVLGLRNALVREEQGKKKAELDGTLLLSMTVNTPEDTDIEHIAQPRIVITPKATVAPLRIAQVTGAVDLDLSRYLTATTIDLDDLRESLGDQDVELNLRAPTIGLTVSNPVGLRMVGGIVLTPYDLSGKALDPVRVEHIAVEASEGGAEPRITRLWISDRDQAPAGYTLCRVERLPRRSTWSSSWRWTTPTPSTSPSRARTTPSTWTTTSRCRCASARGPASATPTRSTCRARSTICCNTTSAPRTFCWSWTPAPPCRST